MRSVYNVEVVLVRRLNMRGMVVQEMLKMLQCRDEKQKMQFRTVRPVSSSFLAPRPSFFDDAAPTALVPIRSS